MSSWCNYYVIRGLIDVFFFLNSGLNFLDLMVRQGNIDNPPKTPLVPGFECSGIVEAVGENTKGFEVRGIIVDFHT